MLMCANAQTGHRDLANLKDYIKSISILSKMRGWLYSKKTSKGSLDEEAMTVMFYVCTQTIYTNVSLVQTSIK